MKSKKLYNIGDVTKEWWWQDWYEQLDIDEIFYRVRLNYQQHLNIRFYYKGSYYVISTRIYKEKIIEL